MERKDDLVADLSQEELQREADAIKKAIDSVPEIRNVYVTEDMDSRMMDRIQKYNEEKALAHLSESDKEALLIGREIQNNTYRARKPKKHKMWIALAAALGVVIAMGMTSVGGKNIIIQVFERVLGDSDKTFVDTDEVEPIETLTEEQAYQKIEEVFGMKTVQMSYKPDGMEFLNMQVDEKIQEAMLYYSMGDKVCTFRILAPYVESSSGTEIKEELLREYQISLPETEITVCEYKVADTDERQYTAQFSYKNSQYFLSGIMQNAEIEEIIKKFHFFLAKWR